MNQESVIGQDFIDHILENQNHKRDHGPWYRDRLLEYNSCRTHVAQGLKQKAVAADDEGMLADYMENVFDCFGVDTELHSENCLILNPTEHMVNNFPGLSDEGMTITYSRDTGEGGSWDIKIWN